jgi:hypothetical protein
MERKLSAQDYMEILRKKRQDGTYDYADRIFYKGKVMLKCPPGSTKSGNTCLPKGSPGLNAANSSGKRWKQDLGGVDPRQIQRLNAAKTAKDVNKAREA